MKSSKPQPAVSHTTTGPPQEFIPHFEALFNQARSQFDTARQGTAPAYQIAPFDPNQVAGQNQILSMAQGPVNDYVNQLLQSSGTILTDYLTPDNPVVQNAVQAAINPAIRAFNEQVMPGLQGEALLTGNVGSSRQGIAQGNAADALQRNILDTSASVTNQAYQTGLDTLISAMAMAPQIANTALLPGMAQAAVGEQRQEQAQRVADVNRANQFKDLDYQNTALANYANILFGSPYSESSATQSAATGGGSKFGSILGLGMQGASLAGTLFGGATWASPIGAGLGILGGLLG